MKVDTQQNSIESTVFSKEEREFTLPDIDVISDWFSDDQLKKLKKIFDPGTIAYYSGYSVYEVYDSKGAL